MSISYPTMELSAVVEDSDGPLDPILLGSFIKNFATLHNAIVRAADDDEEIQSMLLNFDFANDLSLIHNVVVNNRARRQLIARRYFTEHGGWVQRHKGQDNGKWLRVVSIDKHSPFQWVLSGIAVALTGAVIISGGDIKISATGVGIEAHLKPLGTGLQAIRTGVQGGNAPIALPKPRQITRNNGG